MSIRDVDSPGTIRAAYIHDAAVDVAKFFESKKAGTMCAVIEDIALDLCQRRLSQGKLERWYSGSVNWDRS